MLILLLLLSRVHAPIYQSGRQKASPGLCSRVPEMVSAAVMWYCVDWHWECTIWLPCGTVLTGTENAPSDRHGVLCWLALRMHHLTAMWYCVDWHWECTIWPSWGTVLTGGMHHLTASGNVLTGEMHDELKQISALVTNLCFRMKQFPSLLQ